MTDFFPRMSMKANPECDEYHCTKKQKVFLEAEKQRLAREALEVQFDKLFGDGNKTYVLLIVYPIVILRTKLKMSLTKAPYTKTTSGV